MPSSANGSAISPRRAGHDHFADSPVFWTGLLTALAALYILPTTIALIRHAEDIPLVVILNCFPIAWPAALLLACMMPRKEPR